MSRQARWVLGLNIALMALGLAHLLEDFAYDVPERFGLQDNTLGAIPTAIVVALQVLCIAWAARGERRGYLGSVIFGVLWFLAAVFDHLGEILSADYRAGAISKGLVIGIMALGLAVAVAGFRAWRGAED